jgi:hypothetical protein
LEKNKDIFILRSSGCAELSLESFVEGLISLI